MTIREETIEQVNHFEEQIALFFFYLNSSGDANFLTNARKEWLSMAREQRFAIVETLDKNIKIAEQRIGENEDE